MSSRVDEVQRKTAPKLTAVPSTTASEITQLIKSVSLTQTAQIEPINYKDAIASHPFVDFSEYPVLLTTTSRFVDQHGNIVAMLVKHAFPQRVSCAAADVLRPAATRSSLRAAIFGGQSPFSGIAGYYDYAGSPVEFKCRRTSFTHEVADRWKGVFPLVEYANAMYRAAFPIRHNAQFSAMPHLVRIRNSAFSTLTINQRFRTARHTDAGDFDQGLGLLTVLEGEFRGMHLGLPDFGVCVELLPTDLLFFNTHYFHCNTELELLSGPQTTSGTYVPLNWNRLTCVFYYRANLGEEFCWRHYRRRYQDLSAAEKSAVAHQLDPHAPQTSDALPAATTAATKTTVAPWFMQEHDNGDNHNRPDPVFAPVLTPASVLIAACEAKLLFLNTPDSLRILAAQRVLAAALQQHAQLTSDSLWKALFGEAVTTRSVPHRAVTGGVGYSSSSATSAKPDSNQASHSKITTPATPSTQPLITKMLSKARGEEPKPRERFSAAGAVPCRSEDDIAPVNLTDGSSLGVHSLYGGFSLSEQLLANSDALHQLFSPTTLQAALSPALYAMFHESRSLWLSHVKADWTKAVDRQPGRTDFSWNNKGVISTSFFDLCDCAKEVMLAVLEVNDCPSPAVASRFWLAFAQHLFVSCIEENHMPSSAMTMQKLNVKLKDHDFGGTRYFHDMPAEEQARRLLRRQRLADARKATSDAVLLHGDSAATESLAWIQNDTFDYQKEDRPVDYASMFPPVDSKEEVAAPETTALAQSLSHLFGGYDRLGINTLDGKESTPPVTEAVFSVLVVDHRRMSSIFSRSAVADPEAHPKSQWEEALHRLKVIIDAGVSLQAKFNVETQEGRATLNDVTQLARWFRTLPLPSSAASGPKVPSRPSAAKRDRGKQADATPDTLALEAGLSLLRSLMSHCERSTSSLEESTTLLGCLPEVLDTSDATLCELLVRSMDSQTASSSAESFDFVVHRHWLAASSPPANITLVRGTAGTFFVESIVHDRNHFTLRPDLREACQRVMPVALVLLHGLDLMGQIAQRSPASTSDMPPSDPLTFPSLHGARGEMDRHAAQTSSVLAGTFALPGSGLNQMTFVCTSTETTA